MTDVVMNPIVIGIDPGLTGALSLFVNGTLVDIRDMPVILEDIPSKGADLRDLIGGKESHQKKHIDKPALVTLLREWGSKAPAEIVREKVGPRPNQGVVSSSRFLEVVGLLDGIAAALAIPVREVEPAAWKRMTNTPADKKGACGRAASLFPSWAPQFRRTSIDHNRAECALIGFYGVQYM